MRGKSQFRRRRNSDSLLKDHELEDVSDDEDFFDNTTTKDNTAEEDDEIKIVFDAREERLASRNGGSAESGSETDSDFEPEAIDGNYINSDSGWYGGVLVPGQHWTTNTPPMVPEKCPICLKTFPSSVFLLAHLENEDWECFRNVSGLFDLQLNICHKCNRDTFESRSQDSQLYTLVKHVNECDGTLHLESEDESSEVPQSQADACSTASSSQDVDWRDTSRIWENVPMVIDGGKSITRMKNVPPPPPPPRMENPCVIPVEELLSSPPLQKSVTTSTARKLMPPPPPPTGISSMYSYRKENVLPQCPPSEQSSEAPFRQMEYQGKKYPTPFELSYRCQHCHKCGSNLKFGNIKDSMRHLREEHRETRCPRCFDRISCINDGLDHLQKHFVTEESNQEQGTRIDCIYCGNLYDYRVIWDHIDQRHLNIYIKTGTTANINQVEGSQADPEQPRSVFTHPSMIIPPPPSSEADSCISVGASCGCKEYSTSPFGKIRHHFSMEKLNILIPDFLQNPNKPWKERAQRIHKKIGCQVNVITNWFSSTRNTFKEGLLPLWAKNDNVYNYKVTFEDEILVIEKIPKIIPEVNDQHSQKANPSAAARSEPGSRKKSTENPLKANETNNDNFSAAAHIEPVPLKDTNEKSSNANQTLPTVSYNGSNITFSLMNVVRVTIAAETGFAEQQRSSEEVSLEMPDNDKHKDIRETRESLRNSCLLQQTPEQVSTKTPEIKNLELAKKAIIKQPDEGNSKSSDGNMKSKSSINKTVPSKIHRDVNKQKSESKNKRSNVESLPKTSEKVLTSEKEISTQKNYSRKKDEERNEKDKSARDKKDHGRKESSKSFVDKRSRESKSDKNNPEKKEKRHQDKERGERDKQKDEVKSRKSIHDNKDRSGSEKQSSKNIRDKKEKQKEGKCRESDGQICKAKEIDSKHAREKDSNRHKNVDKISKIKIQEKEINRKRAHSSDSNGHATAKKSNSSRHKNSDKPSEIIKIQEKETNRKRAHSSDSNRSEKENKRKKEGDGKSNTPTKDNNNPKPSRLSAPGSKGPQIDKGSRKRRHSEENREKHIKKSRPSENSNSKNSQPNNKNDNKIGKTPPTVNQKSSVSSSKDGPNKTPMNTKSKEQRRELEQNKNNKVVVNRKALERQGQDTAKPAKISGQNIPSVAVKKANKHPEAEYPQYIAFNPKGWKIPKTNSPEKNNISHNVLESSAETANVTKSPAQIPNKIDINPEILFPSRNRRMSNLDDSRYRRPVPYTEPQPLPPRGERRRHSSNTSITNSSPNAFSSKRPKNKPHLTGQQLVPSDCVRKAMHDKNGRRVKGVKTPAMARSIQDYKNLRAQRR